MDELQNSNNSISVVMLGATGMAGSYVLKALLQQPYKIHRITLLGRRKIENLETGNIQVEQYEVDVFNPETYKSYLNGHTVAICTLGVGEPSKVSREELVKVDKKAVIEFASHCKNSGVQHFEILSSVGANSKSRNFYLKVKGELQEELSKLDFKRLSVFQPSMILTPTNRFGFTQWLMLRLFPLFKPLMQGSMTKYRGIAVQSLGEAMALNIFNQKSKEEILQWKEMENLTSK
ncbi:MAG: NAD(P)H-binding protein [Flavobacteriales bacterium]|nr:NAD(P)H-binding protein [Flavobacteriales bacterium]